MWHAGGLALSTQGRVSPGVEDARMPYRGAKRSVDTRKGDEKSRQLQALFQEGSSPGEAESGTHAESC